MKLYGCGPEAMVRALARVAERRGLEAEVSLDPWMGCGVGTCLGCVVWTQKADEPRPHYRCGCTEGPVFDVRDVVWPGEQTSRARRQAVEARP
jgi:dihydroorotate dehydrogenase electron transfer subunit